MSTGHLSRTTLAAGILGIALTGCGNSSTGTVGNGGATGSGGGSGGAAMGTGGSAAGGTTDNAGTTAQPVTGGTIGTGGSTAKPATGGAPGTGGASVGTGGSGSGGRSTTVTSSGGASFVSGGSSTVGSGGSSPQVTGGTVASGGAAGGAATGGKMGTGGASGGGATSGGGMTGIDAGLGAGGTTTPTTGSGTCTASKTASVNATGSGPHKVVVESNSDADIACGTIYRPSDLGGTEKYPIFVWGEGGCTRSGTSNTAAMGEIASYGYFVVADGPANGGGNCGSISMPSTASDLTGMAKPMLGYISWAIAENGKSCSPYYQSLDTTKVAADGFSCGGLMAEGTAGDSRMTTWGITSSGLTSPDATFYKTIHTPVKILLGGSSDIAYTNGERDYDQISALGIPIILFSKSGAGHGGDLGSKNGGDFTKVNLAWLNWQLKGDTGATGKGFLVGSTCTFCADSTTWETKSKNLP